jgi:hypothetical protein
MRTHPYKISKREAEQASAILLGPGPIITRLKKLLEIRTGTKGTHRIGQGFRNDIEQIIRVTEK